MKALFIVILSFWLSRGFSQSSCPDSVVYYTKTMGDGKEQMEFPSAVKIYKDTITIFPDIMFKVISKTCNWNKEQTQGQSKYETVLADEQTKKATISVSFSEKKRIIILYEYSKEQIVLEL